MMIRTGNGTKLELNARRLGRGGEGAIFAVTNPPHLRDYVVKRYKDPESYSRRARLEFMLKHPPSQLAGPGWVLCWPRDLVFENNRFIGYLMPRVTDASFSLYQLTKNKTHQEILPSMREQYDRDTLAGILTIMQLCNQLAHALYIIHRSGYYQLGDFKPDNIRLFPDGKLVLLDLDSVEVVRNGRVIFPASVKTPLYAPRESAHHRAGEPLPKGWDSFSLAVLFYELLTGIHPFAATAGPPYEAHTSSAEKISVGLFVHGQKKRHLEVIRPEHDRFFKLPKLLQQLFHRALDGQPQDRPTPITWGKALGDILADANRKNGGYRRAPPLPQSLIHLLAGIYLGCCALIGSAFFADLVTWASYRAASNPTWSLFSGLAVWAGVTGCVLWRGYRRQNGTVAARPAIALVYVLFAATVLAQKEIATTVPYQIGYLSLLQQSVRYATIYFQTEIAPLVPGLFANVIVLFGGAHVDSPFGVGEISAVSRQYLHARNAR